MKSLVLSFFAFFVASSVYAQSPKEQYESRQQEFTRRREALDQRMDQATERIRELQFIELGQIALQNLAGEKQVKMPLDYADIDWDLSRNKSSAQDRKQSNKMDRFGYGYNANKDLCEVKLEQTVFAQNSSVKVNALAICLIQGKEVVFQATSGAVLDARSQFGYNETFVEAMSDFIEKHPLRNLLASPDLSQAL